MERFNHTNISNETQQYILYKYIYTNSYIYGISVHVVTGLFVRTIYIFRKKKNNNNDKLTVFHIYLNLIEINRAYAPLMNIYI